jgi:hypothetical protein
MLLSVLFMLFISVNGIAVYSIGTMFQFFAILERVGDIFKLGEHVSTRQSAETS